MRLSLSFKCWAEFEEKIVIMGKSLRFFSVAAVAFCLALVAWLIFPMVGEEWEDDVVGASVGKVKEIERKGISDRERTNTHEKPGDSSHFKDFQSFKDHLEREGTNLSDEPTVVELFAQAMLMPSGKEKTQVLSYLCSGLSKIPAKEAFKLLETVRDENAYQLGVTSIMFNLITKEPTMAFGILKENRNNPYYERSLYWFVAKQSNHESGLYFVESLFRDGVINQDSLQMKNAVRSIRNSTLISGQDLYTDIVNKDRRLATENIYGKTGSRYKAALDSGVGINEIFQSINRLSDDGLKNRTRSDLFREITRQSPKEAVDSLKFLDEDSVPPVIPGLVEEWFVMDSEGVGEWIVGLDAGPTRDRAIEGILKKIKGINPEAVAEWENLLTDNIRE